MRAPTPFRTGLKRALTSAPVALRWLGKGALDRGSDVLFALLAAAIVTWVARDAFSTRVISHSPTADYWEHTGVLRALMEDPWHPRHPHVKSSDWSPRFGPHFVLIALCGRALELDALEAASLAAVVNVTLFVLGIYFFFRSYFRNPLASLLGLIVMFASWFEAPHFSNVYDLRTLVSVASYPSTAALGLTLLAFALMLPALRQEREPRWALGLSCFAWAYIYLTHPLTAMLALTGGVLLALTEPGVPRRRRALAAGTVLCGVGLTLLWPYYPALGMVAGGTAQQVQLGLASEARAARRLHSFYDWNTLYNILGLAAIGLLALPYFVFKRRHLFIVLGALFMLLPFAANMFLRIPLGHRFILLVVFFLQTALVWLLLALTPSRQELVGGPRRPLQVLRILIVSGVLLGAAVTNVKSAVAKVEARSSRQSPIVRYARRVVKVAGKGAVVMARSQTAWPLPTFGVYIVAPHHGSGLLSDGAERRHAVSRFYGLRVSDRARDEVVERYQVTHIIVEGRRRSAVERYAAARGTLSSLPRGDRLYSIRPPGSDVSLGAPAERD